MSADNKPSYNPFKMWGSYIGSILSFFFLFLPIPFIGLASAYIVWLSWFHSYNQNIYTFLIPVIIAIVSLIIGFLIGWGVHSLIRKIKSK